MKKLILAIALIFAFFCCAYAQQSLDSYPAQSGLDAAMAVNAMHSAVMNDVLHSDYAFSELAGADTIFVLFPDPNEKNYMMVSLSTDEEPRADMAIVQCYSLIEFETNGLDSLTALALPFIPEANVAGFESWRDSTKLDVIEAFRRGYDFELTYYTGEFITCAMSLMHTDNDVLFTLIVSWNTPLSAENITSLMEASADAE